MGSALGEDGYGAKDLPTRRALRTLSRPSSGCNGRRRDRGDGLVEFQRTQRSFRAN